MKKRMLKLLGKAIVVPSRTIIPLAQHQQPGLLMCAAPITSSTRRSLEKMKTTASSKSTASYNMEWRKKQLDLLEQKFHPHKAAASAATKFLRTEEEDDDEDESSGGSATTRIQHDDDLQPMWKNMESRVKNRRTRSLEESQGRSGRENVKSTDEEEWLRAGLYNTNSNNGNAKTDR
jgi:hypothetical protein